MTVSVIGSVFFGHSPAGIGPACVGIDLATKEMGGESDEVVGVHHDLLDDDALLLERWWRKALATKNLDPLPQRNHVPLFRTNKRNVTMGFDHPPCSDRAAATRLVVVVLAAAVVALAISISHASAAPSDASGNAVMYQARAPESCAPWAIKNQLERIAAHCGPVTVISTFRRGARVRGSGRPSLHRYCSAAIGAVDFQTRNYRCARAQLSDWSGGQSLDPFAVGHIHLSVGGSEGRFYHWRGKRRARSRRH